MAVASGREKIFRSYMKASDFELDHHSDTAYPEIRPHYHEFCELLFFFSGHVDYLIGTSVYHLQRGDLLIIPPNILHNPVFLDFDESYERYVLWFSLDTLKELQSIEPELGFFLDSKAPKVYLLRTSRQIYSQMFSRFIALEEKFEQHPPLWKADVKAFLIQILVDYNAFLIQIIQGGVVKETEGVQSRITDVLNYIHENIQKPMSLDSVSEELFISKYYLSHLFKRYLGISFYQYILQQRLLIAKELIQKGMPIAQAGTECGFKDYSNFYRAFLKEYEISPSMLKNIKSIERESRIP